MKISKGIFKATEHFRKYFLLITDHKALSYIIEAKNPTSRMLRWALKFQSHRFRVEYIKSGKNNADGLSRYRHASEHKVNRVEMGPDDSLYMLTEYRKKSGYASSNNMNSL